MLIVLAEKAVLVNFSIRAWSARRPDFKVTYASTNSANDLLQQIQKIAGSARNFHYSYTLSWHNDGSRVLPTALFASYMEKMQEMRQAYESAVDAFCDAYPSYLANAKTVLDNIFNAANYPDVMMIRSKFAFEVRILPCPSADDFRVDLSGMICDALKQELQTRLQETLLAAQRDVCERIMECVGHMAEKLAAFKPAAKRGDRAAGIFRDSLVENVRELTALLPGLNVTEDKMIVEFTERIEDGLCKVDAGMLREDERARADIAKAAREIFMDVGRYLAEDINVGKLVD